MGLPISSLTTSVADALAPAQMLNAIITHLIRADATRSAALLLKLARFAHRHESVDGEEPPEAATLPKGPFTVDAGHFQIEADLLNYTRDHDTANGADSRLDSYAFAPVNFNPPSTSSSPEFPPHGQAR